MSVKAVALLVVIVGLAALPAPTSAAPGDLDPGFGAGGIVTGSFGGTYSEIVPVLVLPDGRILAGGSGNAGREFALARFTPDGKPDPTFGTGGVTTTAIGGGGGRIGGIALQDDKIVAVGFSFFGSSPVITVARYSYDGVLDPTFQGGGYFQEAPSVGGDASDVAIQADGKIVLSGTGDGFLVQRLLHDGGSDASFDGDGVAGVPGNVGECGSGSSSGAAQIALSGGYIILSGTCGGRIVQDTQTSGLLRYNTGTTADGGALDTSFGSGGAATFRADPGKPTYAGGFAVQPDGKFVQSLQTASGNAGAQVMLVRWNSDGSLDAGFGSGGAQPTLRFRRQRRKPGDVDRGRGGRVPVCRWIPLARRRVWNQPAQSQRHARCRIRIGRQIVHRGWRWRACTDADPVVSAEPRRPAGRQSDRSRLRKKRRQPGVRADSLARRRTTDAGTRIRARGSPDQVAALQGQEGHCDAVLPVEQGGGLQRRYRVTRRRRRRSGGPRTAGARRRKRRRSRSRLPRATSRLRLARPRSYRRRPALAAANCCETSASLR